MPTKKKAPADHLVILDPNTGELKDLPEGVLKNRQDLNSQLREEAEVQRRWFVRSHDWVEGRLFGEWKIAVACAVCIATGAVLGIFGQPMYEKHTQAASLYKAMQTAIPVVNALEVAVDPGKYAGKLVDIIMTPTKGGVFKSGKGLYIAESEGGLSLVIFESAFASFQEAYHVEKPADIASHLIGRVIKARGTVQSRPDPKTSTSRTSMVVYAPGLISVIPERP